MLTLGVPKEIKPLERRVGLTPAYAAELVRLGARVLIESGAGIHSDYPDADYESAGAQIVYSARELYSRSDVIQKVKEPVEPEFELMLPGQIFFCFLHLASPENFALVKALLKQKVTAIAFETLSVRGRIPLLAPMSEIAGGLSAAYAAFFKNQNAQLPLIEELVSIAREYPVWKRLFSPGKVVIWGGGIAGQSAAATALKLGGEVTVIEKDAEKHFSLKKMGVNVFFPDENFDETLKIADVFIGAVHSRGARALQVLTAEKLRLISSARKKIIMDISIDQGGNFPESHPTTYPHPVYLDSPGNLRFCVPNIPSLCGRPASQALSREALAWTEKMLVSPSAWCESEELRYAVNVHDGKILMPEISSAHGFNGQG